MGSFGVPTLLSAQRLSAAVSFLKRNAETARAELASGRVSDLPAALGASIGEAFSLRSAIDLVSTQRSGLSQARLIAQTTQLSLSAAVNGAQSTATDTLAAIGRRDEGALALLAADARGRVESVFSQLNARVGGRSLFAGDASDGPALASTETLLADVEAIYAASPDFASFDAALSSYFEDPAGGFRTAIYLGGEGDAATIEVAPGDRVSINARADDPGIRSLLRGLATIAVAGAAGPLALRDAALGSGAALVSQGAALTAARQAEIGIAEARIDEAFNSLEAEEATTIAAYNELTARDPFEAASRLQALEAQLNAALILTSRVSQFSLANYLR